MKAVVLVVLLLAGCSTVRTGETPRPSATTTTVEHELTLDGLVSEPCAAVTDLQATTLGIAADGLPSGPACTWRLAFATVVFEPDPTADRTPASGTRTTIGGWPAAQVRAADRCSTHVSVGSGQSIEVTVTTDVSFAEDPCWTGEDWAEVIVWNLR